MGGGSGDDLALSVRRARDGGGWDSLIQGPTDISVFEPKGGARGGGQIFGSHISTKTCWT